MSDNLFWILFWIFVTPFGWMGLICFGLSLGIIFQGIRGRL